VGVNTAVIDIGTNTILLLVLDGQGKKIVDEVRFGRLGQGLDASGQLSPEAIERSLAYLREYRTLLDEHGVAMPTVVATQAVREASNAADFTGMAGAILCAEIEVIDGRREAELAFRSVARTFPHLAGRPYIVADVGGGSTEVIVTDDGRRVASATSLPIGAVRMTERYLKSDPPTPDEMAAMIADIDRQLDALRIPTGVTVVGTAGTATTIAAIDLELAQYDAEKVTGLRLDPKIVERQLHKLATSTIAGRKTIRGMEPQRADVIVGGVAIYARLLQLTGATSFMTCDRGIRWGLAYERMSTAPGV